MYGAPGAGKTNLALSAAVTAAANGETVLFIDTEGFPKRRLQQLLSNHEGCLATDDTEAEIADRIQVFEAYEFDGQGKAVKDAEANAADAGLIVLDSATGFYRLERDAEAGNGEVLREVARQLITLLGAARRYDLPVLVTNQVYTNPESGDVEPLGGHTVGHWTSVILHVEQLDAKHRRVTVEKHHAAPTGEETVFSICNAGLTAADADQLAE